MEDLIILENLEERAEKFEKNLKLLSYDKAFKLGRTARGWLT